MAKKADLENYVFGKVQPQAVPLEAEILGTCMEDKDAFFIAASVLNTKDFYVEAHGYIWDAFQRLTARHAPVDILTVMEELKKSNHLDAIGGPPYLAELTNRVASGANIEYHARIVLEKSIARSLIHHGSLLITRAYDDDPLELLIAHTASLTGLMSEKSSGVSSAAEVAQMALDAYVEAFERKGEMKGETLTGIYKVDKMLNGASPGDLILFAARPKIGKSSVAGAIVMHFVLTDRPLYYASGEEQKVESFTRVVSGITGIPADEIESGRELNNPIYQEAHTKIATSGVKFYTEQMNLYVLKSHIALHMRLYGTKIFMIDRFELFEEISNCRPGGADEARTKVASSLRAIVNQLKIAIIIFAQCNADMKNSASKRPTIYNVYGQTPLQANCNKILLLDRPEEYGSHEFSGTNEGISSKNKMEIFVGAGNSIKYASVIVGFDGASRVIRDNDFDPRAGLGQLQDGELPF